MTGTCGKCKHLENITSWWNKRAVYRCNAHDHKANRLWDDYFYGRRIGLSTKCKVDAFEPKS